MAKAKDDTRSKGSVSIKSFFVKVPSTKVDAQTDSSDAAEMDSEGPSTVVDVDDEEDASEADAPPLGSRKKKGVPPKASSTRKPKAPSSDIDMDSDASETNVKASKRSTEAVPRLRGSVIITGKSAPHMSDLPPIHDIPSIFKDIVLRFPEIINVAKKLDGRPLRVATMCSGTESPLLALGLASRSLREDHNTTLNIQHVFSCEIEPFKQAYIERNFSPPILFRDVCELGNDEATTAYGAKVKVPGNVDMLIAGTSCVDYSTLNNSQKGINDGGESGRTFHGMLSWVTTHRPLIVILENVCQAPWADVVRRFERVGYSATFIRLDTKNYYIPHTRTRGYLMAVNVKGSQIPQNWKSKVVELSRPASSTLDAFLLPTDDPRIHQARQKLVHEALTHERKAGYEWGRCESRHIKARFEEKLGSRRPLTGWEEGGTSKLPSFAWNDWGAAQVDRVWDLMDITTLRSAKLGKDTLFKTEVWNLSQNVDRRIIDSRLGVCTCLTPTMIPYLTNRGGPMVGREALGLQGLPVDELLLTRETEDQIADLAGNAMSSTVVGTAMLVALTVSSKLLAAKRRDEDAMDIDNQLVVASHVGVKGEEQLSEKMVDLSEVQIQSLPTLLEEAASSVRFCECEGRDDMVQRVIQRCVDCGSTTCSRCSGRPEHNYVEIKPTRTRPTEYRKLLRDQLPMSFTLHGLTSDVLEAAIVAAGEGTSATQGWKLAALAAFGSRLDFKEDKRQETWVVVYESSTAILHLHLHPVRPEWLLYGKAEPSEPANSPLRPLLEQPIARSPCPGTLLGGTWEVAVPTKQTIQVTLKGTGELIPSWESKLGLEADEFREKKVWSALDVSYSEDDGKKLDRSIAGTYNLFDRCGTANSALHKKEREDSSELPMFLFLDPARYSVPGDDSFVFSHNIRRLEHLESRTTILKLDKSWRPSSTSNHTTVTGSISFAWIKRIDLALKPSVGLLARYSTPTSALTIAASNNDCSNANAILLCSVPLLSDQESKIWTRNIWTTVDPIHERATFKDLSWLLERVRTFEHLVDWAEVQLPGDHSNCERCAPTPPALLWTRGPKGTIGVEDPQQAGRYEQALKHRPSPFVTRLMFETGTSTGKVHIGINIPSLLHRALSRLPSEGRAISPVLTWRLTTGYTPPVRLSEPRFRLLSNRQDKEHAQPPNFKLNLRPEQLRSLEWMIAQESDAAAFLEEEVAEAILQPLGWRVEAKAQRPVRVSGGVLADEVGYGKTAITLGLVAAQSKSLPPVQKKLTPEGKIRTNATCIAVPPHLTRQWASEIKKFQGEKHVKCIESVTDLNKLTIQDVLDADYILFASALVKSDKYIANLAAFAGISPFPNKEGRFFDAKLKLAHATLKAQVETLKKEGSMALFEAIKFSEDHPQQDMFLATSKRLKGTQYRDKMHEDTVVKQEAKPLTINDKAKQRKLRLFPEVVITTVPKLPGSLAEPIEISSGDDEKHWKIPRKAAPKKAIPISDDEGANDSGSDFHASDHGDDGDREEEEDLSVVDSELSDAESKRSEQLPKKKSQSRAAVKKRKTPDGSDDNPSEEENTVPATKKQKTSTGPKPVKPLPPIKKIYESDPWKLKSKDVRDDWTEMRCPPLEIFHFERLVVDEFTYLTEKVYPLVTSLRSNHRWILSGTPPTQDFAAVKSIAEFMGVHLGVADDFYEGQSKESVRDAKRRNKDQTGVESFHSFREVRSLDWHAHRNEIAQRFLDHFVRQNIAEIDEIPSEDNICSIILPAAERAIYLELEHHLRALDMTLRKGKKTKSDREKRLQESLGESKSAEEALLKRCSHFELEANKKNALKACDVIVEERRRQLDECVAELDKEICKALEAEKKIGPVDYNSHFRQWLRMTHSDSGVGDRDAKADLHRIQNQAGYRYHPDEKRQSPNLDREPVSTKDKRWEHREHSHVIKKLEKELVARHRSLRYFAVVRDLQQGAESVKSISCPVCGKEDLPIGDIAILSSCGHTGCRSCVLDRALLEECVCRQRDGCTSAARSLNVVNAETLGKDEVRDANVKHFGMKLEEVVRLIKKTIPKDDRVLLFVQFSDLMKKTGEALASHGITFLQIQGSNMARAKALENFQKPEAKEKVLLLNVGDESASGANLTVANHVIFLSPLLTPFEQFYRATDTQAIGRLRRFGQRKTVFIYRFLTLNSIDIEIFEARDGRKVPQ